MADEKNIYDGVNKCLSDSVMKDYLSATMDNAQKQNMEKHIAECPFCADAIEGYNMVEDKVLLASVFDELNEKVKNYPHKTIKKKTKIISIYYNKKVYFTAAATLLILLGVFLFTEFRTNNSEEVFTDNFKPYPAKEKVKIDSIDKEKQNSAEETITDKKIIDKNTIDIERDGFYATEEVSRKEYISSNKGGGISGKPSFGTKSSGKDISKKEDNAKSIAFDDDLSVGWSSISNNGVINTEDTSPSPTVLTDVEIIAFDKENENKDAVAMNYTSAETESVDMLEEKSNIRLVSVNKLSKRKTKKNNASIAGIEAKNLKTDESSLIDRAMNAYSNKIYKKASTLFEKVLKIDTENTEATFYCAVSHISNDKPKTAIYYLDKIILSQNIQYLESAKWYKAMALLKLKKKNDAISILNEIVKAKGNYAPQAEKALQDLK